MPALVEGTPAEYGYGPVQPAPAALASNGTIQSSWGVARVTTSGNVTGIVMSPGTGHFYDEIVVVNESANTITFAASGSNVADGSASAIPANSARKFVWTSANLWYRVA